MEYDIKFAIRKVNEMEPKQIFKLTDLILDDNPSVNKVNGKAFKNDVDSELIVKVKSIGKDKSNIEWYVRTF